MANDSVTKKPIQIRNDNGLEGIFVYGFDSAKGQQLYIDAVRNLTSTGYVDGLFGDKWSKLATPQTKGECPGEMCICNHECGSMSTAQGSAWNQGKAKVLAAVLRILGDGPYFQNGGNYTTGDDPNKGIMGTLKASPRAKGDPRQLISGVKDLLGQGYKYVRVGGGDQKWGTDPNDPVSLQAVRIDVSVHTAL